MLEPKKIQIHDTSRPGMRGFFSPPDADITRRVAIGLEADMAQTAADVANQRLERSACAWECVARVLSHRGQANVSLAAIRTYKVIEAELDALALNDEIVVLPAFTATAFGAGFAPAKEAPAPKEAGAVIQVEVQP